MNPIIPPIRFGDQGPAVANLQQALFLIVQRRQLSPGGLPLPRWQQALSTEVAGQTFGNNTQRLLLLLLSALQIPPPAAPAPGAPPVPGVTVDEPTARALNQVLQNLNAFEGGGSPPAGSTP